MISKFRWVRIKRKSGSILLDNQQLDLGEFALVAGALDEINRWKAKDDYEEECSDYSGTNRSSNLYDDVEDDRTDRSSDFDDDEMEFDADF